MPPTSRSLAQTLELAGLKSLETPAPGSVRTTIRQSTCKAVGERLRAQLTVAKVICLGESSKHRRRPRLL